MKNILPFILAMPEVSPEIWFKPMAFDMESALEAHLRDDDENDEGLHGLHSFYAVRSWGDFKLPFILAIPGGEVSPEIWFNPMAFDMESALDLLKAVMIIEMAMKIRASGGLKLTPECGAYRTLAAAIAKAEGE